jgi:hypothetical protein
MNENLKISELNASNQQFQTKLVDFEHENVLGKKQLEAKAQLLLEKSSNYYYF